MVQNYKEKKKLSNTYNHKIQSMYNSGALDYIDDEPPFLIKKKWDRDNWDIGESRKEKKNKKEKELKKQLKIDLDDSQ